MELTPRVALKTSSRKLECNGSALGPAPGSVKCTAVGNLVVMQGPEIAQRFALFNLALQVHLDSESKSFDYRGNGRIG